MSALPCRRRQCSWEREGRLGKMGRVLIACEYSGIVRDAFIAEGHDAISCDLLPTERPGPHIQGDVKAVLQKPWGLVIAHPPCTYLCNSGVRWLWERPERWDDLWEGVAFFLDCLQAKSPLIAVENPVPHRYAVAGIGRKADFSVQPWQFGDPETKRTCFWTKGLPPLIGMHAAQPVPRVHRMAPGPSRSKERARFPEAMAVAMAKQWGCFLQT